MFGHMLRAFQFGAPPHGGIALGPERLVMLLANAESLCDVELMTGAPSVVDFKQLRETSIQSTEKPA